MVRESGILTVRVTPSLEKAMGMLAGKGYQISAFVRRAITAELARLDLDEINKVVALEKQREDLRKTTWILNAARRYQRETQDMSVRGRQEILRQLKAMVGGYGDLEENKHLRPIFLDVMTELGGLNDGTDDSLRRSRAEDVGRTLARSKGRLAGWGEPTHRGGERREPEENGV